MNLSIKKQHKVQDQLYALVDASRLDPAIKSQGDAAVAYSSNTMTVLNFALVPYVIKALT